MAFNPLLLAAMSDVEQSEAGLASGVVNTAFMMGGALGLAVLASLAAFRTDTSLAAGESSLEALNGGYQVAFLVGGVFAATAAALGAALLRVAAPGSEHEGADEMGVPATADADEVSAGAAPNLETPASRLPELPAARQPDVMAS